MAFNTNHMGYFGAKEKVSRGPWFKTFFIEDDGLEYFYRFNSKGQTHCLLTNNVPLKDRERMQRHYSQIVRNTGIEWIFSAWVGWEVFSIVPYFRTVAPGWKVLSVIGLASLVRFGVHHFNNYYYGPVMAAQLKKHIHHAKTDMFEIEDEKREFFYIDTSEYMNYSHEDLTHDHHAHHGPQPDGEVLDQSW